MPTLAGKVVVVAGATRSAGRGIAIELGIAGATVYCTGRSVRGSASPLNRPETLEETVELVESHGGKAQSIRVDHTSISEVDTLFDRVLREQGRLDLMVNTISSGSGDGNPAHDFLTMDVADVLALLENNARSHIITAHAAAQRMIPTRSGLIVSISDNPWPPLTYALQKSVVNGLHASIAHELKPFGITALALKPGAFYRCFDIMTEQALQSARLLDPDAEDWAYNGTPRFIGRAVVALAGDPPVISKTGTAPCIGDLAREYGFVDIDDRIPEKWSDG